MSAKLKKEADNLFGIHEELTKLYMTSDGQGFTNERYARDHAKNLRNKTVTGFSREIKAEKNEKTEILPPKT